jgi:SAM-dependent methyltransferase
MRQRFVRRLSRALRARLGRDRAGAWRVRTDPVRGRSGALEEESGYWSDWLAARGGKWAEEFARRFDPEAEVEDGGLREVLAALPPGARVLDVGAGPASTVGTRFRGQPLELVAVDPLAEEYARSLSRERLVPPVPTQAIAGEELTARLGPDRFDVAYSRNALDHAVDPAVIVDEMVGVVRPGGVVVLDHVQNEGERNGYEQLHQWNFDVFDGHLIVWRNDRRIDLTDRLRDRADVRCRLETRSGWPVVLAQITRRN